MHTPYQYVLLYIYACFMAQTNTEILVFEYSYRTFEDSLLGICMYSVYCDVYFITLELRLFNSLI